MFGQLTSAVARVRTVQERMSEPHYIAKERPALAAASMARNRLDFQRSRQHVQESITADSLSFAAPGGGGGGVGASSFVAPMMSEPMGFRDIEQNEAAARAAERLSRGSSRRGQSISFGGGAEELAREPVAVVLLRSRPGSAGGPTILPGLRDSRAPIREQDLSNQVSHLLCESRIWILC